MTAADLVPILVFVAVLLSVTAAYLLISSQRVRRKTMSRRLGELGEGQASRVELGQIRRGRSLSAEGHFTFPIISLNQLVLQSGVTFGLKGVLFAMTFLSAGAYFVFSIVQDSTTVSVLCAALFGIGLPIYILRSMRKSRQRKFETQLPEALDILVRGLRAGHAIPVAISTVGRQMPAPLGNEFSIAGSELTYGLDLETTMINLRSRVGQSDLSLVVLAISIQARMGGNLAEILTNLSKVIRERFKLRRKTKALTAEGRYSAIFLSLLPAALFGVLWLIAPSYYGQVWDVWFVQPALGAAIAWMAFGNYVMYRMVKFGI